jgi:predicted Ser/Thr protein kinase
MTEQDRTPDKFGPYRVLDRIGEGGMGVVYLATDSEQRPVAVKVLRPAVAGDPNARRRLAREVETMRRVRSPFVADVIDADVTSDPPYIVTRYVRGRTLEQVVTERGPLRGQELATVGRGLAAALTAVHAAGVVHRDLKPGNVMLADGEPVVIDFGIAHAPDSTRITQTGMFMGTPGYLAPEVIEGKETGRASDVHSWGATVAFAATGRPPFGTGTFEAIFYRIVHGQPDLEGCPSPLLPLVAAALARDPSRRPSAADLNARVAALAPASLGPGAAPATGPGELRAVWPGGLAWATGLGGADGAAGAGGAAVAVPQTIGEWGLAGLGMGDGTTGPPGADSAVPAATAAPGTGLPGAGVPGAGVPGAGVPGEGVPGAGVPGAGPPAPGADWRHETQPLAIGNPAGPAVGDLLPPVRYAPPGAGPPAGPSSANGRAASPGGRYAGPAGRADGTPSRRRMRTLFVLAAVLVGVGVSVILPIAGTAAALGMIVSLRAADLTQSRLARRRATRGIRASDPAMTALTFPAMVLWSIISGVLLAPVALVAAGIAAGITIVAVPVDPFPRAVAYGAGALVAYYGLGPGSGGARRQLGKLFDAVGGSPGAAVVALIGVSALAVATIVAAASQAAFYWPLHHLSTPDGNLHALRIAAHSARTAIIRLAGRVVGG